MTKTKTETFSIYLTPAGQTPQLPLNPAATCTNYTVLAANKIIGLIQDLGDSYVTEAEADQAWKIAEAAYTYGRFDAVMRGYTVTVTVTVTR